MSSTMPQSDTIRPALLDDITQWVTNIDESELARNDFMLWHHGPTGTGGTAIAKRIAAIAADKNFLLVIDS